MPHRLYVTCRDHKQTVLSALSITKRVDKIRLHIAVDLGKEEGKLDGALLMDVPQAKVFGDMQSTE